MENTIELKWYLSVKFMTGNETVFNGEVIASFKIFCSTFKENISEQFSNL